MTNDKRVTDGARPPSMNDSLARVEALALTTELFSDLRHDLRNKLGAIRTAAAYLRVRLDGAEELANDPRIPVFLDLIDREIASANQMLEPASVEVPKANVDVQRCVTLALGSLRAELEAPTAPAVETDIEQATVVADEGELAMAIRCLLKNAVEATNVAADAKLSAAPPRVRVEGRREGSAVVLSVHDQGPPIPDDVLVNIVRPFFTTKPGRLGLGATVSNRVVKRFGGELMFLRASPGLVAKLTLPMGK